MVKVYRNGSSHPDRTVASGAITLDLASTKVQVGLANRWRLETLRPEGGSLIGTSQGKLKRIHKIILRLYKSLGLKYGDSVDTLFEENFSYGTVMGEAPPLFSGDKVLEFDGDYDNTNSIVLEDDGPFPIQFQAIMIDMVTEDAR